MSPLSPVASIHGITKTGFFNNPTHVRRKISASNEAQLTRWCFRVGLCNWSRFAGFLLSLMLVIFPGGVYYLYDGFVMSRVVLFFGHFQKGQPVFFI